jgi:hypothetical protein
MITLKTTNRRHIVSMGGTVLKSFTKLRDAWQFIFDMREEKTWNIEYTPDREKRETVTLSAKTLLEAYVLFMKRFPSDYEIANITLIGD